MAEKVELVAIVRVRGWFGMNPRRRDTLEMLNLPRSNNCSIMQKTPSLVGMLHDVKDYATWGPISEKMLTHLLTKRATKSGKKLDAKTDFAKLAKEIIAGKKLAELEIDRTFRLTPPDGGWKNRKQTRPKGDLGPRPSMDELIKAMA